MAGARTFVCPQCGKRRYQQGSAIVFGKRTCPGPCARAEAEDYWTKKDQEEKGN